MKRARSEGVVLSHSAPVPAYILSVDKSVGRSWLDELFAPGGLRQKLMRAGKTPPLR